MMPGDDARSTIRRASDAIAAPRLAIGDLVRAIPGARLVRGDAHAVVTGVRHDSRRVERGDAFVARAGGRVHGATFVPEALARGATAVIAARGVVADTADAAVVEVPDAARALAFAAFAVYGRPTDGLEVVGITGTNGKTTTAQLVHACIDACGGCSGVVGTLGCDFGGEHWSTEHTSPEADELMRIAAAMRARGATHLVMEVSSIALAAARADAVRFRVAAFTNLTQDHLDFHGSMDAYAAAKRRLFVDLAPAAAAFNIDDPFGRALAVEIAKVRPSTRIARFSASLGTAPNDAEIAATRLEHTSRGIEMDVRTPVGDVRVVSTLVGAHNASNLVAALAIAWLLGLDLARAAAALGQPIQVAGRLERCDTPGLDDVIVLVDYAHTPDALERVLASVRVLANAPGASGRIACVFGCGGDRDPTKRPLMGAAAARGADVAIVTNDNPRSEEPRAIADAILAGMKEGRATVELELDRAMAIERAVVDAVPGDVVLIAGKGHEPYQILGPVTVPFDDREQARRALAKRRGVRGAAR